MKLKKTIIITGTHHTPAIEIINQLKKDDSIDWNVHYIGHRTPKDTHINNSIIPTFKERYHDIYCGKFHRRSYLDTIVGIPATIFGLIQSLYLVYKIKPDITISFGGYVSVPVIIASRVFNVPSITHEQTITISLATKINSFFSTKVALTFESTINKNIISPEKINITGNPIRAEIYNTNSTLYSKLKEQITNRPLIYITGGSQGSTFINQTIFGIIKKLSMFTIIHQTGETDLENIKIQTSKENFANYYPTDYVGPNDIGWVLNNASIIVSRSGANICFDLLSLNKKAILIPLFFAQQNEQLLNAKWLQSQLPNQVIILDQLTTTSEILLDSIIKLSKTKNTIAKHQPIDKHLFLKLIHDTV